MIPDFEKNGNLPSGIYNSTFDEFEDRYCFNIRRKTLVEGLKRLINDLKKINCKSIYIDGSFVTNKLLPNDIDVCWENAGIEYDFAELMLPILFDFDDNRGNQRALYYCDIFPARLIEMSSSIYFIDFFQRDKYTNLPKGIIKLEII